MAMVVVVMVVSTLQLLEHVEQTSPECVLEQGQFQSVPTLDQLQSVPTSGPEELQGVEGTLLQLLHQQQSSEQSYIQEVHSQAG